MDRIHYFIALSIVSIILPDARDCYAQRVRFPSNPAPAQVQTQFQSPTLPTGQPPAGAPGWRTIPPYSGPVTSGNLAAPPSATIAPPNFDGFSTQPGAVPPPGAFPNNGFPPPPAYPGQQPGAFSGSVQPMIAPPNGSTGLPNYNPNPPYLFPNPQFPQVNPPSLQMPRLTGPGSWFDGFRGTGGNSTGINADGSRDWIGRSFWSKFERGPYLSLFQEFRFGHTYLYGNRNNQLQIHDTEIGTTMNYPNFFNSGQPLRISPGFIFHSWDGPQPPHPGLSADLPSRAYSAFLATDWSTATDRQLGADINFSIGLYTDFNTLKAKSLRFKGTGLGRLRLAPDLTMRFGVTYLDRLEYKLLPAFGFFWTPTDDARLELFFPYPKVARRMKQVGNSEVWTYARAELGGDTFTIERADGSDDQVDIVDYRVLGGVEWNGNQRVSGFAEFGYVFNRDLIYRVNSADNLGLDDTFILRTGLSF